MISIDDFIECCLVLGIPFNGGGGPNAPSNQVIFQSVDINAKVISTPTLFTTVAPRYDFIIPTELIFIATSIAGFSSVPIVNVGSDSGGSPPYSNLYGANISLGALAATGNAQAVPLNTSAWIAAGAVGTLFKLNITTAAVASTFTMQVLLKGIGVNA